MAKIRHAQVRAYVTEREPFRANNLYAVRLPWADRYIVYSYGPHFPLLVHTDGHWFENWENYSPTTRRHLVLARPFNIETTKLTCEHMVLVAERGIVDAIKYMMTTKGDTND